MPHHGSGGGTSTREFFAKWVGLRKAWVEGPLRSSCHGVTRVEDGAKSVAAPRVHSAAAVGVGGGCQPHGRRRRPAEEHALGGGIGGEHRAGQGHLRAVHGLVAYVRVDAKTGEIVESQCMTLKSKKYFKWVKKYSKKQNPAPGTVLYR